MPSLPLRSSPGEFVYDALLSEQARVAITSRHGGDDGAWCRHLRHLVIHSGDGGAVSTTLIPSSASGVATLHAE